MILPKTKSPLAGRRLLVVEDEVFVAMLIEDVLEGAGGAVIGPAARVDEALALIEAENPDGALLDVNLGGELVYPVAEALARLEIPFVFVTGYGAEGIAPPFKGRPTIKKPFLPAAFVAQVVAALGDGKGAGG
ncbi:MAG: response regulator [Proteobacteria bacterium]|nr:response regulator [Pseudomonadota bacterium]